MARGRKTGGRDFKPGECGNLHGRTPTSPDLKAAKKLTAERFQECVNRLTAMTQAQLKDYIGSGKADMLEMMIAGQIGAGTKGKSTPVSLLLDRTVGAVKRQVDLNVSGSISHDLQLMTDEQKESFLAELESRSKKD